MLPRDLLHAVTIFDLDVRVTPHGGTQQNRIEAVRSLASSSRSGFKGVGLFRILFVRPRGLELALFEFIRVQHFKFVHLLVSGEVSGFRAFGHGWQIWNALVMRPSFQGSGPKRILLRRALSSGDA